MAMGAARRCSACRVLTCSCNRDASNPGPFVVVYGKALCLFNVEARTTSQQMLPRELPSTNSSSVNVPLVPFSATGVKCRFPFGVVPSCRLAAFLRAVNGKRNDTAVQYECQNRLFQLNQRGQGWTMPVIDMFFNLSVPEYTVGLKWTAAFQNSKIAPGLRTALAVVSWILEIKLGNNTRFVTRLLDSEVALCAAICSRHLWPYTFCLSLT